jgi:hypothetical protein
MRGLCKHRGTYRALKATAMRPIGKSPAVVGRGSIVWLQLNAGVTLSRASSLVYGRRALRSFRMIRRAAAG